MKIIGLTGGIASGKSAVAAALARRGAVVFDADKLGHHALAAPEVRDALARRWGDGILDSRGAVSRAAVAERVFGPTPAATDERRFLEQLVHPFIRRQIESGVRQLPDGVVPAVVIDAALLVESGWNDVCSEVVFVDCPREIRLQRAVARGWTQEEFARRESAQMPIEEKRAWCRRVIDNSGDLQALEKAVERFWLEVVASQ
jgi:dephospho-CoA kinase